MRHRIERYPGDFAAHLGLGTLLLNRKESRAAATHLREALRFQPENALTLNNLGAALQLERKMDEAVEQFRHALRIQPEYPNAQFNLGNALAAQGNPGEAAASFRRVLVAFPEDHEARGQLSAALVELAGAAVSEGRLPDAAESYRELVDLDSGNPDLRNNLGIILVKLGDLPHAIDEFEAALKINPSHAAARRNLDQIRKGLPK